MRIETEVEPDASAGYERRDVNPRAILWLMAGVTGCALVAMAALWILINAFERQAASRDPARSPLVGERLPSAAPELQPTPVHDYQAFQASQERALTTYGWVDREKSIVRLPVERAMQLLLERGEPTTSEDKPQATTKSDQKAERNE